MKKSSTAEAAEVRRVVIGTFSFPSPFLCVLCGKFSLSPARILVTLALGFTLTASGCSTSSTEPDEPPAGVVIHSPFQSAVVLRTEARDEAPQWAGTRRWTERETAVDAIGRIGGREALSSLVDLLHGTDDKLSIGAARALAMLGPEAKLAVPDLVGELANPNADVRKNVMRALGQIGGDASAAIKPLMNEITRPESDSDVQIERDRKPRAKVVVPGGLPLPPTTTPATH
jgi:hypothetical protein